MSSQRFRLWFGDLKRRSLHILFREQSVAPPLILGAVLYAIFNRTLQEFITDALPIAVFLAIILYSFLLTRLILFWKLRLHKKLVLLAILYMPLSIVFCTVIYWSVWMTFIDGYKLLQLQSLSRGFFLSVIGVLLLVSGFVLFIFRLRARFFFGLSEAVVGLIIALRNVPANADPLLWGSEVFLLMLSTGIFLIVRGFDNMYTGMTSKPHDIVITTFLESEYGALAKLKSFQDSSR